MTTGSGSSGDIQVFGILGNPFNSGSIFEYHYFNLATFNRLSYFANDKSHSIYLDKNF